MIGCQAQWHTAKLGMLCLIISVAHGRVMAADQKDAGAVASVEIPAPVYVTLMLVRDGAIHDELKLSEPQRFAMREVVSKVDQPLWLLRDVPPKECAEKLESQFSTLRKGILAALTPAQSERFDQLVMQSRGAKALLAPDIQPILKLSTQQTERISAIISDTTAERVDAKRLMATLTGPQKNKLNQLFGSPFDMSRVTRVGCVAPEFQGIDSWLNGSPQKLEQLRGKVVVVHFWAFGCINCVRNLPHYQKWYEEFPTSDLTIVGVHTPETAVERELEKLQANVAERGIKYPIAVDAQARTWQTWANNLWPSVYLIDRKGQVRSWWYGELNWQEAKGEEAMRRQIAALIREK